MVDRTRLVLWLKFIRETERTLLHYLLSLVLAAALGTLISGGDLQAVGRVMSPDMTSMEAFFSPGQVLMLLFSAFMSAVYNAVMSAPAAVIYREIRARSALA